MICEFINWLYLAFLAFHFCRIVLILCLEYFWISILALLFAVYTAVGILKKPEGTDKMKEISKAVHEGAMAFLHKEYRTLAIFMVVVTAVLYYLGYTGKLASGKEMAVAFVVGGFFSA